MKKFILMFVILNTLIIADNNFKNPDGRPFLLTIQTNLYDGRYSYRSWNEDYYDYDDVESFNYKVLDRCNGECSKKIYFSWKMPVSKHVTLSGYYNKSIYPSISSRDSEVVIAKSKSINYTVSLAVHIPLYKIWEK